jgi:hypothetical protein
LYKGRPSVRFDKIGRRASMADDADTRRTLEESTNRRSRVQQSASLEGKRPSLPEVTAAGDLSALGNLQQLTLLAKRRPHVGPMSRRSDSAATLCVAVPDTKTGPATNIPRRPPGCWLAQSHFDHTCGPCVITQQRIKDQPASVSSATMHLPLYTALHNHSYSPRRQLAVRPSQGPIT